jgi:Txe/YoeB family toxin of Txe-Axe toxin-antitoxin module
MAIKRPCRITFLDLNIEKSFFELDKEDEIKKHIQRAINDIKQNAFCGIQIPKRLIPEEYKKKYEIKNLWKYDLPQGWRLIYSIITPTKAEIISLILNWFPHKEYERRFNYFF